MLEFFSCRKLIIFKSSFCTFYIFGTEVVLFNLMLNLVSKIGWGFNFLGTFCSIKKAVRGQVIRVYLFWSLIWLVISRQGFYFLGAFCSVQKESTGTSNYKSSCIIIIVTFNSFFFNRQKAFNSLIYEIMNRKWSLTQVNKTLLLIKKKNQ